jgi:hypothetical protein
VVVKMVVYLFGQILFELLVANLVHKNPVENERYLNQLLFIGEKKREVAFFLTIKISHIVVYLNLDLDYLIKSNLM